MKELVEKLKKEGVLRTPAIIKAFLDNDRKDFILPEYQNYVYEDAPLPIDFGQTISQPFTVAFMLEKLRPEKGQRVLDVGFGSGWTTALLSSIVGSKGQVYAIEILAEVFEFGEKNLEKLGRKNIKLRLGSGWDGWPEFEPYDRILVSAAASEVPKKLKRQLVVKGRMVIPVGASPWLGQSVKLVERLGENDFKEEDNHGFAFVPLVK